MTRLPISILALALLCLPAFAQATSITSEATLGIPQITLGQGAENWAMGDFRPAGPHMGYLPFVHFDSLSLPSEISYSNPATITIKDGLGQSGGEAILFQDGPIESSAFFDHGDLVNHIGSTQADAWSLTSFFLTGQGHGVVTISVPYTLTLTRAEIEPVIPTNMSSVYAFTNFSGHPIQQVDLRWDGTQSLNIERQGVLTFSQEFTNPKNQFIVLQGNARATSIPEPSSLLLLACAVLACVIAPRVMRRG